MSKEDIWRHREAGTCHLCEQPVLAGQAANGATGAHWDCCEKLDKEVQALLAEKKGELVLCIKACGGWHSHWVNLDTHVALCGDKPKNTASRMKARGRWMRWKDQDPNKIESMCQKCSAEKLSIEEK